MTLYFFTRSTLICCRLFGESTMARASASYFITTNYINVCLTLDELIIVLIHEVS